MKNSLLLMLALCSASVLATPVDKSPSLPVQLVQSDEVTPQNSDEDTSKPPTKDSISTAQGTTSTFQESRLQKLPGDVIMDILSRTTLRAVLNLRATCTSFRRVSTETVEMPFLDNIRNYNRDYLRDQRLEPLLRRAFPFHNLLDTSSVAAFYFNFVRSARKSTSFPFNMRNHEQVLVKHAQKALLLDSGHAIRSRVESSVESALLWLDYSIQKFPNIQKDALKSAVTEFLKTLRDTDVSKLGELQSSLSTLKGSFRSLANSGISDTYVDLALAKLEALPSWPQNKDQVKDLVISVLKQVEKSFKKDEYDLDHNDQSEMELAVAYILHQRYAPILSTRPSIERAKEEAKRKYLRLSSDLNVEEKANIERGIVQTLGPDHEKILELVHILHITFHDAGYQRYKENYVKLEANADLEAETIALLVPKLEMDQVSVKKVFEQARWSVKLGFAVKYKLADAVRGLLKSLEIFGRTTEEQLFTAGPTIERHYNAAIETKCKPLIKAFEESGRIETRVETTEPETSG